jgi:copper(I)-binding protein
LKAKTIMKRLLISLLLSVAGLAFAQVPAPVKIDAPWLRPSVQGQATTGAYMTLTATEPLTLLGATTPAAGSVELHQMQMDGDVMRMRAIDTLALTPNQPVRLAPGGYHFMVMQPKTPFRNGTQIPLTLRFRDAKGAVRTMELSVPVAVSAPAGSAAPDHKH